MLEAGVTWTSKAAVSSRYSECTRLEIKSTVVALRKKAVKAAEARQALLLERCRSLQDQIAAFDVQLREANAALEDALQRGIFSQQDLERWKVYCAQASDDELVNATQHYSADVQRAVYHVCTSLSVGERVAEAESWLGYYSRAVEHTRNAQALWAYEAALGEKELEQCKFDLEEEKKRESKLVTRPALDADSLQKGGGEMDGGVHTRGARRVDGAHATNVQVTESERDVLEALGL